MFHLTVPGEPVAKARPRAAMVAGRARLYTPKKTVGFEQKVALFATQARCPFLVGPVSVTIRAFWEYPKGSWRVRTPRRERLKPNGPDADNVAKAVCDALNGVAWADDRQVCRLVVEKWYARQGDPARVEIEIGSLEDPS